MSAPDTFDKDYLWGFRRYQFLSFMMLGIVNPLLMPFFQSRGMDKAQVGWLMAVLGLTALVVPPVWGLASDSARDRRIPLLAAIVGAAAAFLGFFLCHSFLALLGVMLLFGATFKAIIPLGIGLTFAWAEPAGRDYSRIRMFGSAGYVVALLLMWAPLHLWRDRIQVVFPCFLVFAAAAAAGLLFLPKIAGTGHRRLDWHALKLLGRPAFAVTVACTFVAQAAIGAHYTFFSQYVEDVFGIAKRYIVFFWAFGSVVETAMYTQLGRLLRRFGTKWVLTAGMAGIALRLGIYALVPSWPVIFLVQGFHALTFGAVHASTVTFVNYAAPTRWRQSAQTLFEGITIGLGMSLGALAGGYIARQWGYPTLFGCASAAAALACVVYAVFGRPASLAREPEESPGEGLAEQ